MLPADRGARGTAGPSRPSSDGELQAAFASRHIGRVIRAYRHHPHHGRRGISQDDVATWAGMAQSQVSKTETGPPTNRLDRLIFWAQLLGMPEEHLWFKLPRNDSGRFLPVPVQSTGVEHGEGVLVPDTVDLSGDVEAWELFDALTRSTISVESVGHLESAVLRCAERYPIESPLTLGPKINRQLARIREALDGPQPLAVRRQLVRLLGYLCGLAANIHVDRHDPATAARYFDVAVQASQEASDRGLAAWVGANRAIAYDCVGATGMSRSVLDEAAHQVRASSSRRRQAWVVALHARACAATGDGYQAMRLLDESEAVLAEATEPVGGTDFFDDARLQGVRGTSLLLLGDFPAAEAALAVASERRAGSEVKGRALLTLDLARCRLFQGEHDDAIQLTLASLELASASMIQSIAAKAAEVATALEAVDAGHRVRPVVERLIELDRYVVEGSS